MRLPISQIGAGEIVEELILPTIAASLTAADRRVLKQLLVDD
jgi:hypothetical protein